MDRRLTTIVAADLAGYSRLMAADEEGTIARLRAARAEVIDPAVSDASGRIVKSMGDGLLIEFPSPVAAVRCVAAAQGQLAARETGPEDQRLRFRVGVNLGDVVIDGDDILGDGVNIAARLESLAPPGGICISRSVYDQLRGKIDHPMTGLGPQMVKNLPDPIEVWRVEMAGAVPVRKTIKAQPTSIAVLPFDNMSSDPEQEFLADGIVEDVITELSRFRSLFVIARNSTFAYKGTPKDIREIARELGVGYVVEGAVRRAGNRLRVTAQLIEAETGRHLWADRWDRTMEDLFDLQDEMTRAIIACVEPELGAHERAMARAKPTESLTAWELCQKGFAAHLTYRPEGYAEAIRLYTASIAADPGFAIPHALFARLHANAVMVGRSDDPVADLREGLRHADRAVELDDKLDLGHAGRGVVLGLGDRSADSLAAFDRALALNPNQAITYHWRATTRLLLDECDADAIVADETMALRLNPKDPLGWGFVLVKGLALLLTGHAVGSLAVRDAMEQACRYPNAEYFVFVYAAMANADCGRQDDARHYLAEAMARRPDLSIRLWHAAFAGPNWTQILTVQTAALEKLVALGLPRR